MTCWHRDVHKGPWGRRRRTECSRAGRGWRRGVLRHHRGSGGRCGKGKTARQGLDGAVGGGARATWIPVRQGYDLMWPESRYRNEGRRRENPLNRDDYADGKKSGLRRIGGNVLERCESRPVTVQPWASGPSFLGLGFITCNIGVVTIIMLFS